ncbi:hypothetical protein [Streptomyces sp. NPDC058751]|uniref:hypothetical protein n=1 Tax=Streptomyces sp. NPDC058751 TaxID=3346623 RepID=UPI0036C3DFC9
MDIWGTLFATVVGAAIALLGQHLVKRAEHRARISELLLEQCAYLAASSSDFHNRVWEERVLDMNDRVSSWDVSAHGLASARLQILSKDRALLSALQELNNAGQQLGSYWRRGVVDEAEFTSRWNRHRIATEQFIATSGEVVHRRLAQA